MNSLTLSYINDEHDKPDENEDEEQQLSIKHKFHGIVYRLYSKLNKYYYIGSTENSINIRLKKHIQSHKQYIKNKCIQCSSVLILDYEDWNYEILYQGYFTNKYELKKKEDTYINLTNPFCVNIRRAFITPEQKRQYNIQYNRKYNKQYYNNNKQYYKDYYKNNIERYKENYQKQKLKQKLQQSTI